jgi:hypothetical protein
MRSFIFILLLAVCGCSSSNSQSAIKSNDIPLQQSDVKEINGFINNFFKVYKDEGSSKAVDYLFSTNKTTSKSQLYNIKNKLDSTQSVLGRFTGYRLITEKNISDGLVLFSYLVKHENHPVRFTFVFYKPINNWIIYKFLFDADVEDELEQSGKIYFIK